MKTYITGKSREGLVLPHSGRIIGLLADAMRLKTALREDLEGVSYKTVQRYFNGERVEPEHVQTILNALLDSLIPPGLNISLGSSHAEPTPAKDLVGVGLRYYVSMWDNFASHLNSLSFPVTKEGDLPLPFLRLLALDLGIRWGAWQILEGHHSEEWGSWWKSDALGKKIDEARADEDSSVEDLADRLGISPQALHAWRTGESLPTNDNIERLAAVLSRITGQSQGDTEYGLRLLVGVQAIRKGLYKLCGQDRIDDMFSAMVTTARLVYEGYPPHQKGPEQCHLTEEQWEIERTRVLTIVVDGARSEMGAHLAEGLAAGSPLNKEVAADFQALRGNWIDRAGYWTSYLGSADKEKEVARQTLSAEFGATDEEANLCAETAFRLHLRMAGFDFQPGADMRGFRVSHPPEGKALNRAIQANRAMSIGRYDEAIEHYRKATEHQPLNPVYHFKLGAILAELGHHTSKRQLMEDGLKEVRIAVALDPEFGNARNEIGIILGNLGLHEEAEEAFEEASPYYNHHAHHRWCRGRNLMVLEEFERAEQELTKAIEFSKEGRGHVEAMIDLTVTLMKLGRTREARRLGKRVHHLTGLNPVDDWEDLLRGIKP